MKLTKRLPDFNELVKVLKRESPSRPVMFEFILGETKEKLLVGDAYDISNEFKRNQTRILAFRNAGYDHCPILLQGGAFYREAQSHQGVQTKSLNEGGVIGSREQFDSYPWPDITRLNYALLEELAPYLEGNMKFIPYSFDGILENAIGIVGYENLCYMLYDDPDLFRDIFAKIGAITLEYYERCLGYASVGAILCNDDWGFNSQTMLSPSILRKVVFPWYKKIVEKAHKMGKYAIVHSCGYYRDIIDDMVNEIGFDGKHSYEDNIVPVEQAYDELHNRIAIMGGIDMNFLMHKSPQDVKVRCKALLQKTKEGGYALGSGNSIPDFIPTENYLALLRAGLEDSE
ncbi:MAG: uroporphyrinogen decarboxylase family protein [Bacilli bacterium]|nr:uroporphyrinogen decarboxylase family protein [Bacilli bacterium]